MKEQPNNHKKVDIQVRANRKQVEAWKRILMRAENKLKDGLLAQIADLSIIELAKGKTLHIGGDKKNAE